MDNIDILIQMQAYAGAPTNNPSDASKITERTQESNLTGFSRQTPSIADATVDQSIDCVPEANTEYLMIFTDQTISIKLNGGSEAIILSPRASGTKTFAFFNRGAVTSLTVSNSSGNIAKLDIIMASV